MMTKSNNLVITNYDNFKNADFFKQQYLKAQEMIQEVNDFYKSFCMSKLLTSSDLKKYKPLALINCPWTEHFIFPYDNAHILDAYFNSEDYNWMDFPDNNNKNPELLFDESKEYAAQCINDINIIFSQNPEYDCYYVLDEHNIIREFIPIKCKDTIQIDFSGNDVKISGYYFSYNERTAQFGQMKHEILKHIVTIVIDQTNNNIKNVDHYSTVLEEGNASGKSYWDDKTYYYMTDRTLNAIRTDKWRGLRYEIKNNYKRYKELQRHSCGTYFNMDISDMLYDKYKQIYEETFHHPLTKKYIEYCCNSWY